MCLVKPDPDAHPCLRVTNVPLGEEAQPMLEGPYPPGRREGLRTRGPNCRKTPGWATRYRPPLVTAQALHQAAQSGKDLLRVSPWSLSLASAGHWAGPQVLVDTAALS